MKKVSVASKAAAFLIIVVFLMSGLIVSCAPLQPQLLQMQSQKQPMSLTILKTDLTGNGVSKESIMGAIATTIASRGARGNSITHVSDGPNSKTEYVRGVKVNTGEGKITVVYYNGEKSYLYSPASRSRSMKETTTDMVVDLPVEISDSGDKYNVKVGYPSSMTIVPRRPSLGGAFKPFGSSENIEKDLDVKLSALQTMTIQRNYQVEGSLDSKYGCDATMANFSRLLKSDGSILSDGTSRSGRFTYHLKDQSLAISVSVAPYRNGSKVTYFCTVPYTVGSTISITQEDIDSIKQKISKVIND